MLFFVDECLNRHVVAGLHARGHDVTWAKDGPRGEDDEVLLAKATVEGRIVVTEDQDFGELTVRFKRPAIGIVIAAISEFDGSLAEIGEHVAETIDKLGVACVGNVIVIEPGRVRQRAL